MRLVKKDINLDLQKKCDYCGALFFSNYDTSARVAHYCSDSHRVLAAIKRKKENSNKSINNKTEETMTDFQLMIDKKDLENKLFAANEQISILKKEKEENTKNKAEIKALKKEISLLQSKLDDISIESENSKTTQSEVENKNKMTISELTQKLAEKEAKINEMQSVIDNVKPDANLITKEDAIRAAMDMDGRVSILTLKKLGVITFTNIIQITEKLSLKKVFLNSNFYQIV